MRKTILATASALAISIVPALAEMPGAPVGGGGHVAMAMGTRRPKVRRVRARLASPWRRLRLSRRLLGL
jgi:hypothetical protein